MKHFKPERTSDPVMAILIRCYDVMPTASNREKAQWCLARQRELQRDGKVASLIGHTPAPLGYTDEPPDPVIERLCGEDK